jgi:hypothetical protein
MAAWRLGAGRARREDPVSAVAGVICLAKPGDRVERGQPLLELRGDAGSRFAGARDALAGAIEIGPRPPGIGPLILERIQSPGAAGSGGTRASIVAAPRRRRSPPSARYRVPNRVGTRCAAAPAPGRG